MNGIGEAERRDRLRLARTEGVGPVAWRELMRRYGSAARALEALPNLARRGGRTGALKITTIAEAQREMDAGRALGAVLLTAGEAAFPPLLVQIDPPPPVLWALGHPALLGKPAVAIVGARIASAAGQRFARTLAVTGSRDRSSFRSGPTRRMRQVGRSRQSSPVPRRPSPSPRCPALRRRSP